MPRGQVAVRQADIKRAVGGVEAAGLKVARVEVDFKLGRVVVLTGTTEADLAKSETDQWYEAYNAKASN